MHEPDTLLRDDYSSTVSSASGKTFGFGYYQLFLNNFFSSPRQQDSLLYWRHLSLSYFLGTFSSSQRWTFFVTVNLPGTKVQS